MNNVLEGGINSPIRHLLNCHRGVNFTGQQKNSWNLFVKKKYVLKQDFYATK